MERKLLVSSEASLRIETYWWSGLCVIRDLCPRRRPQNLWSLKKLSASEDFVSVKKHINNWAKKMQQMLDSNLLFTTTLFQAQLTIQPLHYCNAGIKFWMLCSRKDSPLLNTSQFSNKNSVPVQVYKQQLHVCDLYNRVNIYLWTCRSLGEPRTPPRRKTLQWRQSCSPPLRFLHPSAVWSYLGK